MTAGKEGVLASTAGAMTHRVKQVQRDLLITDLRVRFGLSRGDRTLCATRRDSFNQEDNSGRKGEIHKPKNVGQESFQMRQHLLK